MKQLPYFWKLGDLKKVKPNGATVFSTFACGGGSSMGYKLAGFDVVGCNEIDPRMMERYKANLNPRIALDGDIRDLVRNPGRLPKELYSLDILDGSPPCSTFSMAGNREKDWGVERKFTEGQAAQTLDDLFFEFIALAKILQPKVVIAENVKGIILGNAASYVSRIYRDFDEAGYVCQHWLLNAAAMGVPQARERVFFIAVRKDLKVPELVLNFNFRPVPYSEIEDISPEPETFEISENQRELWRRTKWGKSFTKALANGEGWFGWCRVHPDRPLPTLLSSSALRMFHYSVPRHISRAETILMGTFPQDYDFGDADPGYLIGMSVPPLMTAGVAGAIWDQWGPVLKAVKRPKRLHPVSQDEPGPGKRPNGRPGRPGRPGAKKR